LKTILVSGLAPTTTQDELRELFEEHGKVMGVDLVAGQNFGYVRMTHEAEGREAIDALDGATCSGAKLSVEAARTRRQQEVERDKVAGVTEVASG
jgi:RNA recognition motif-containing protein